MAEDVEQRVSEPRGRKSVPWRRDPTIMARLARVERLHLAGWTNVAVAAEIGVNEITIRRDLERIQELWRERVGGDVVSMRAQIVAELEDTRVRALAAAEFDEMAERAVLFGEGDRAVTRDDKGSATFRGNKAAAIAQARQAAMDKAKILGLVVDKVAPTNADGDDIPLDALMERFARARGHQTDAGS